MDGTILAVVGQIGGGIGAFVVVLVYIFREWRKDSSTLGAANDQAAIALIREGREERGQLREEMGQLRERLALVEQKWRDQMTILQTHAAWDAAAMDLNRRLAEHLRDCGHAEHVLAEFQIGHPPALYPPSGPLSPTENLT